MPTIRVDDKGKEITVKKRARRVALLSMGLAFAGVASFMMDNVASGLFLLLCSDVTASIWNLIDRN